MGLPGLRRLVTPLVSLHVGWVCRVPGFSVAGVLTCLPCLPHVGCHVGGVCWCAGAGGGGGGMILTSKAFDVLSFGFNLDAARHGSLQPRHDSGQLAPKASAVQLHS